MLVKNFRISREMLELRQKDVAKVLGVDFTTVSGWETGKDTIPLKKLISYANHFDLSLDYLFGICDRNTSYKASEFDLKTMAENLKIIRKKNNMTQREVAHKMNTTQSAYSHYETATNLITTAFLYNLTKIYDSVSIDELLNREKKEI